MIAACLPMMAGCIEQQEMPTVDGPYIAQYYDGPGTCDIGMDYQGNVRLYFSIDFYSEEIETYSMGLSGERGKKYEALCQKHGDNGYHGKDPYANSPQKICYAKDFKSITVTTMTDYDSEHPAGSSLDDITAYDAYTPLPWISSGYNGMPEFTHFIERVKDVKPDEMSLLCYAGWFSLYFITPPTETSTAKIKVTLTTDGDEVLEFEKDVLLR